MLVRDGDRTVLTMANDFKGELSEFAVVVPVPSFIEREQIHVTENALVSHLDAYTAPRLVEYFDEDPCRPVRAYPTATAVAEDASAPRRRGADALGVTIEASYTVGEYDILILSAEQSDGLIVWLRENGYRIPDGAERAVGSYLKQDMRFFVAKVNLEEQSRLGYASLRPLQVAYETPKFMLPIRLGMLNADGPQELFIYTLTRSGRVETTNYRTVKLPTGSEIPPYVKAEFGPFYRDMFRTAVGRERGEAVFLEYAWDMAWCDPCAADPLSAAQLKELGVFWLEDRPEVQPMTPPRPRIWPPPGSPAKDVFVTRLHVRYDAEHFPEDLVFQETGDRENFQGRFVLRHPWTGEAGCEAGEAYLEGLPERLDREARTLAHLTGWDIGEIREKVAEESPVAVQPAGAEEEEPEPLPWWRRLWN